MSQTQYSVHGIRNNQLPMVQCVHRDPMNQSHIPDHARVLLSVNRNDVLQKLMYLSFLKGQTLYLQSCGKMFEWVLKKKKKKHPKKQTSSPTMFVGIWWMVSQSQCRSNSRWFDCRQSFVVWVLVRYHVLCLLPQESEALQHHYWQLGEWLGETIYQFNYLHV